MVSSQQNSLESLENPRANAATKQPESLNHDSDLSDPDNSRAITADRQERDSGESIAVLPDLSIEGINESPQTADLSVEPPKQSLSDTSGYSQVVSDIPTTGILPRDQLANGEVLVAQVTAPVAPPPPITPPTTAIPPGAANNIVPFTRVAPVAPAAAPAAWKGVLATGSSVLATTTAFLGAIFVGETELQRRNADQFYRENGYRIGELPPEAKRQEEQLRRDVQAADTGQIYGPSNAEFAAEIARRNTNDSERLNDTIATVGELDRRIPQRQQNLANSLTRVSNESTWTQQIIDSGFIVTPDTNELLNDIGQRYDRLDQNLDQLPLTEQEVARNRNEFNQTAGQAPGQRLDEANNALFSTRTYDRRLNDTTYEADRLADVMRQTRNLIKADEVVRQRGNIFNGSENVNQAHTELGQELDRRALTIEQLNQRIGDTTIPPEFEQEFNRLATEAARRDELLNQRLEQQQREFEQLEEGYRGNQSNINESFSLDDDTARMVRELQALDRDIQGYTRGVETTQTLARQSREGYQDIGDLLDRIDTANQPSNNNEIPGDKPGTEHGNEDDRDQAPDRFTRFPDYRPPEESPGHDDDDYYIPVDPRYPPPELEPRPNDPQNHLQSEELPLQRPVGNNPGRLINPGDPSPEFPGNLQDGNGKFGDPPIQPPAVDITEQAVRGDNPANLNQPEIESLEIPPIVPQEISNGNPDEWSYGASPSEIDLESPDSTTQQHPEEVEYGGDSTPLHSTDVITANASNEGEPQNLDSETETGSNPNDIADFSELIRNREAQGGGEGIWYPLGDGTGVKVFDKNPEAFDHAVESLRELRDMGYPVPEVHEVGTANGHPAIRIEEIPGQTVQQAIQSVETVEELQQIVDGYDGIIEKAREDGILFDGLALSNMIWNGETNEITIVDPSVIVKDYTGDYPDPLLIEDARRELRSY